MDHGNPISNDSLINPVYYLKAGDGYKRACKMKKNFFFFLFFKLKYGREQSRGISESLSMGHIALLIPTSKKGLISCISAGTLALVIIRFLPTD